MQPAKLLICCLLLAVLIVLPACTLANVQTRDNTFPVGESPRVEADVDISRLAVRPGTAGEVRIEATLHHARQTDYRVTQTGDTIRMEVRMQPGFSSKLDQPAVEIILTVPKNTDLDLHSSTGYLYVNDASGHIALTSVAGGIQLSDCEGRVELQNQTGSIACRRVQGTFAIRGDAGKVTLDAVNGVFDVQTNSGAIQFEGELAPAGQHRFETATGIVDLLILGSPDLRLDASSQAGSVRCSLEMSEQVHSKRECKGVLGEGTAELQVRTSTGSITIH